MKQCNLQTQYEAVATRKRMEQDLDEAERKAHRNLAIYKFMNFGYWAAIWTHLNRVGNFHRPNPFSDYVKLARAKAPQQKLKLGGIVKERG